MKVYKPDKIKNIAILGHGGSGKTSLMEAILYKTGMIERLGKVEEKNTFSDFSKEEQERQISIFTSICVVEKDGYKLNFMDTPGYVDFIGEVEKTIPIIEGAIININAAGGVEGQTIKCWNMLKDKKVTKIIFVNKMDKEEANFDKVLEDIKSELGIVAPFIIPLKEGNTLKGVINILEEKAYIYENGKSTVSDIPEDMKSKVEELKEQLMDAIADVSEELMEKYLEEGGLTEEDIKNGLEIGFREGLITPLACGSATSLIGIEELINIIIKYFPAYSAKEKVKVFDKQGEEKEIPASGDHPFVGFVWKSINEMHVGDIIYVKVLSGKITANSTCLNTRTGFKEKIGTIAITSGKTRKEVSEVYAGDIVTLVKLKDTKINDTLCDPNVFFKHPEIEFSEQVISVAVVPKSQADQEKVTTALHSIIKHDPSLRLEIDSELRQMILHGMGQIHLDVVLKMVKDRYGVDISTKKPKVPYRETIQTKAEAQYRHKKQTGGAGQFAEVWLRIEPLPRGTGFEFGNEVFGGAISQQFIPSVEKGVRTVLATGVIAGYPIIDIKAVVYDGKEHPVDSKDIAFQIAARNAFKEAFLKAKPILLEPIYNIEIRVPEKFMGDIIGDLNSRRGRIMGMSAEGKYQLIKAQVPLAEMYQYINDLRSMTQGRGEFKMRFSHYEEVPPALAEKIIAESKSKEEES